jgi:predicted TPR repeat methyltransferase
MYDVNFSSPPRDDFFLFSIGTGNSTRVVLQLRREDTRPSVRVGMSQWALYSHHQECVEELFDGYAETFDESLVKDLRYDVPSLIRKQIKQERFSRCLDLGCGTGLVGPHFRSSCDHLEGVDIANLMVKKASTRGVYDKLAHSDLVAYLRTQPDNSFDLLISADVVIYIWDMKQLFDEAKRVLSEDGIFTFSTESANDEEGDVVKRDTERFAHSRNYIMGLSVDGFSLESVQDVVVRNDGATTLRGDIFVFRQFTTHTTVAKEPATASEKPSEPMGEEFVVYNKKDNNDYEDFFGSCKSKKKGNKSK